MEREYIKRFINEIYKRSAPMISRKIWRSKEATTTSSQEGSPRTGQIPFLDETSHREYQLIVGVCQWLVVSSCFYLNYAVSSLARFAAAPRQGHIDLARHLFRYLKKYPAKEYMINSSSPCIPDEYQEVEVKMDFGNQYWYFTKEMDS